MSKLLVNCEGCGRELERWPSAIRDHVYCTQACRTIRRKRACAAEGCEVEFVPRRCDVAVGKGRYCSVQCAAGPTQALRRNGEQVTCPVCGRSRYHPASHLRGKRYELADGGYRIAPSRYCSPECFHIATRKGPAPEPRDCPACGKSFTPRFPAFDDQEFCSRVCWGNYRRDERPETLVPLFQTFDPQLRQKAIGRLLGRKAGRLGGRPRGYDHDVIGRVLELRLKGVSIRSIGRIVGLNKNQVSQILMAEKVSRNPF